MSHIKVTCTDDCNAGPGVIAGQNYLATDSKEYTSLYKIYDLDKIYIGLYRKDRFTITSPVKEPTMTEYIKVRYIDRTLSGFLTYGEIYLAKESEKFPHVSYDIFINDKLYPCYKSRFEVVDEYIKVTCVDTSGATTYLAGGEYLVKSYDNKPSYLVYTLDRTFVGTYFKTRFRIIEKENIMTTIVVKPLPTQNETFNLAGKGITTHVVLVHDEVVGIFPSLRYAEQFENALKDQGYLNPVVREIA